MRSKTYVATISFIAPHPLLRVILGHESLDICLVGFVLLGVYLLILSSSTVSPTFGMSTSFISALCLVISFMLEVRQGLGLFYGFVCGLDLTLLQLCLGQIV